MITLNSTSFTARIVATNPFDVVVTWLYLREGVDVTARSMITHAFGDVVTWLP